MGDALVEQLDGRESHFIRETRRLTGFSPQALRQGFLNDEAFWAYRAWAQLAGYEVPERLRAELA